MISLTTRALLPFYKVEDVTLFCEIFATADDNFKGDLDIDAWYVWGTILYGWAWAVRERPGGGVRFGHRRVVRVGDYIVWVGVGSEREARGRCTSWRVSTPNAWCVRACVAGA